MTETDDFVTHHPKHWDTALDDTFPQRKNMYGVVLKATKGVCMCVCVFVYINMCVCFKVLTPTSCCTVVRHWKDLPELPSFGNATAWTAHKLDEDQTVRFEGKQSSQCMGPAPRMVCVCVCAVIGDRPREVCVWCVIDHTSPTHSHMLPHTPTHTDSYIHNMHT